MPDLLIKNPDGFEPGYTAITEMGEAKSNVNIDFGILKLLAGEEYDATSYSESAYLLMNGKLIFYYDSSEYTAERYSLFDEEPIALHAAANKPIRIKALTDCELAVSQVQNAKDFETMVFDANNILESEHRGKGLLDDTAYRIVRTIFDIRNRPEAQLVLGEVITFPGRWSSYPPHHHPQPEIYHYRFTEPQGFGFSQSGDFDGKPNVVTLSHYDTLKILYSLDHAQVAAPGYGMYYIWVIKHLSGDPYTVPEFTEEHAWTMNDDANQRAWSKK